MRCLWRAVEYVGIRWDCDDDDDDDDILRVLLIAPNIGASHYTRIFAKYQQRHEKNNILNTNAGNKLLSFTSIK